MNKIAERIDGVSDHIKGKLNECEAYIEQDKFDSAWKVFNDALDSLSDGFLSSEGPEGKQLVHYTSMDNMFSMLESMLESMQESGAAFRMYSTEYFNDPSEGCAVYDQEQIEKLLDTLKQDYNWLGEFPQAPPEEPKTVGAYACCFSSPKDMGDDLLFWRLYGDDGKGCSIKTAASAFRKGIVPVEYIEAEEAEEIRNDMSSAIVRLLEYLDGWIKPYKAQEAFRERRFLTRLREQTLMFIEALRFYTKNDYYSFENEYRYIEIADVDKIKVGKSSSNNVRFYLEGPRLNDIFATGSEITIGPAVDSQTTTARYLNYLLNEAGKRGITKVKTSRKIYRNS